MVFLSGWLRRRLRLKRGRLAPLAAVLVALAGPAAAAPALGPGVGPESVTPLLRAWLAQPSASPIEPDGLDLGAVRRFYAMQDFRPVWIGNPQADPAVAVLEGAGADGLDPARFHAASLAARQRLGSAVEAAEYDMALTDGLLRYAREIRMGQVDPATADDMVGLSRTPFDPVASLAAALASGRMASWFESLPPAHPEYARLKAALARYREAVAGHGWPKVAEVRKIELRAGNPELNALRERLAAEDPALRDSEPEDLTALESAVKRFQAENGLEADGVVGRKTIEALNASPAARVARIEANMERWRWLPHAFPTRYVEVNAADATLKVVDGGKVVLASRVIVGKPRTKTAIFNADIVAVTVNPPWNVPSSIARNEILPKLRRNPAYLAQHHMVMVEGQIRQLPGDDNALGYLKMEMPNRFTAYLHDTASRGLFEREERHMSHGCIRVQQIRPLASYALTGNTESGLERIAAAIAAGATQKIALDRPLPVFVLYWTAIANTDGSVDFRPDVYGRDKRLIAALAGRPAVRAASLSETGCRGWAG